VTSLGYATPIDASIHGEHRITAPTASTCRFTGRIGSAEHPAEAGRYHLYAGWFCPWSQRATIQLALNGLAGVVSVSYVDGLRDGRGWAFRAGTGPDPVNGFTLLREVYEATRPGYTGPVSVPVLWDRQVGRVVSNDPATIDVDFATQFRAWAPPDVDTYPIALRSAIDELDRRIGPTVNQRVGRAVYDPATADRLLAAFGDLNTRLAHRRYLLGEVITVADVRLWVTLVRYDAGPNAHGAIGPKLPTYRHLWRYARELYSRPAFRDTTDLAAFTAPFADVPDWTGAAA
jgi:putative glutathione S-transferase